MADNLPVALDPLAQYVALRESLVRLEAIATSMGALLKEVDFHSHLLYRPNGSETMEATLRNQAQALEALKAKLVLEALEQKVALDVVKDKLGSIEKRLATGSSRLWSVLLDLIKLAIIGFLGWLFAQIQLGTPRLPNAPPPSPPALSAPVAPH